MLDDLFLRDKTSINNAISVFEKFPKLTWRGIAHILTFVNSLEMLPYLKASGCRELFVGIESGSIPIRQKINKPGTPEKIKKVIIALLQSGIDVKGYFMYGFPDETIADATFALASEMNDIAKNFGGNFRLSVFQFRHIMEHNSIMKS